MSWSSRRELMHEILRGERCVLPASVYDGLSARVAEDLGFELIVLGGSVASYTVIAAPDLCVLTLSEFAEQAYRINRASELPLLVDADHGYGNALNVKRTVEELEKSGVSALTIEDTLLPIAFGSGGKTALISIEEGVGKMRAALAGRRDPRLAIVGRTNIGASGLPDAIARLKAYEAAGVDALFMVGITARAQISEIAGKVRSPLILAGDAPDEARDPEFLAAHNVKVALVSHDPFWASVNGIYEALKQLRAGAKPRELKNVAPPELRKRLLRDAEYQSWQDEFLG
jgi:carboxyvinyl-carboxyphosphonate phosphorylmutase